MARSSPVPNTARAPSCCGWPDRPRDGVDWVTGRRGRKLRSRRRREIPTHPRAGLRRAALRLCLARARRHGPRRSAAGDGRAARAGTAQPPRDGHSGSKKTLALSRRLVLCPGLTAVVEEHVRSARLPNVQGRPPATGRSAVPIAGRHLAGCRPAVNPCQSPPAGTRRGGCCISPDCLELPRRHLHGHIYRLSAPDRPRVTGSDLQDRHSGDDGAEVRRVGVP